MTNPYKPISGIVQYTGKKPHLKVWRDGWRCIGRGFDILGETPEKAYANWKARIGRTV